ncbi:MAG: hypothetical protein KJO26_00510 [Deltaproteobacteria bacterium]|nr:hypothetical protein [Deltaproteobacteria bacterium]
MRRSVVITGFVILIVSVFLGLHHFKQEEIRVVKIQHESGTDKEVWIYKKSIFGKKKKTKELVYYSNGNKESEIDYKKGTVNGWAKLWYKDGMLHAKATYKNGKNHGIRTAYHKNGRIFCRAEYKKGELINKKNRDEEGNEIYLPIDRE